MPTDKKEIWTSEVILAGYQQNGYKILRNGEPVIRVYTHDEADDEQLVERIMAALREQPAWIRVIDEELVCAHLDVADVADDYATAKDKINKLICWHVAVATDPVLNEQPTEVTDAMVEIAVEAFYVEWGVSGCDMKATMRAALTGALSHQQADPEHCPKCHFTMSGVGRCVNCAPVFNKHGHEDRCNLMFPATMNGPEDYCDCAASKTNTTCDPK